MHVQQLIILEFVTLHYPLETSKDTHGQCYECRNKAWVTSKAEIVLEVEDLSRPPVLLIDYLMKYVEHISIFIFRFLKYSIIACFAKLCL